MNKIKQDILSTLAYFDIFQYPLTKEEILLFRKFPYTENELSGELEELLAFRNIHKIDGFYSLHNNISLGKRRRDGNNLAVDQMKIAARSARLVSRFPYVRGVAVSGSLSKNFAEKGSDIDFFIITAANRLWIARSILHIFLKFTYIVGKQSWFCLNYYVDEEGLEIPERNIFTAVEIVTLLPMYGDTVFSDFSAQNQWTKDHFPFFPLNNNITPVKKGFIKSVTEAVFNNKLGDKLDNWLMRKTGKRWMKKTKQQRLNDHGIRLSMITGKHYAKPDPQFFQPSVIKAHQLKLEEIMRKMNAGISVPLPE